MEQVQKTTLLTEGPIWKRMTAFAFPLFLGNLFQQLYNTADSLIVGNFLGSNALAAVSSSGSLIFLLVGFFNGIAIGAGVVIAKYYGARQTERLQKAIHTTIGFGIISGILLTIIGILLAPQILIWMKTPADVLPNSILYFRIYFLGSPAFVLYTHFVGILQSVGDSRHPLYYLIFSSLVNIVLDLLFVGVFHGRGSCRCCDDHFTVFECSAVSVPPDEKKPGGIPCIFAPHPSGSLYASSDHQKRTACRNSEFDYFNRKCSSSVEH